MSWFLWTCLLLALALSIATVVLWGTTSFVGPRGSQGMTGPDGESGPAGEDSIGATGADGLTGPTGVGGETMGYAYATQLVSELLPASDVSWLNGAFNYPSLGIVPPATGGTSFVINETGIYEYDYRVSAVVTGAKVQLELRVDGSEVVDGSESGSPDDGSTGFTDIHSHGIAAFSAGDQVALHNVGPGAMIDTPGEADKNASLRIIQIA